MRAAMMVLKPVEARFFCVCFISDCGSYIAASKFSFIFFLFWSSTNFTNQLLSHFSLNKSKFCFSRYFQGCHKVLKYVALLLE